MTEMEAALAVTNALELDDAGEDGMTFLAARYSHPQLMEIYDAHKGYENAQRYVSTAMLIKARVSA